MTPGIKKKKPDPMIGMKQPGLPSGWTVDGEVESFRLNADGTITARINVMLVDPGRKVYASEYQTVRFKKGKG